MTSEFAFTVRTTLKKMWEKLDSSDSQLEIFNFQFIHFENATYFWLFTFRLIYIM